MTAIAHDIEIVALATDQAHTLDALVERLHRHLSTVLTDPWSLTIVDYASHDDTFAVAQRLAGRYISTRARRVPERMDRKDLRRLWQASESTTVAFLELSPDRDIVSQLAPLLPDDRPPSGGVARQFTRRNALFAVGGVGMLTLVAACGSAVKTATSAVSSATSTTTASNATTASTSTTAAGTAATSGTVVLAPEMTEGPYYLDLDLVRSNIVEDRTGAALALDLVVTDVKTQKPIQGAVVDIWHADANGAYSGFVAASASANGGGGAARASTGSDTSTFLRGTQVSDASGKVSFATIYPGWYTGRTVHIHVKVHVSGREIHTGQLFFDDTFTDTLYASNAPYSSRGTRDVRNANDGPYSGGGAQSTLVVQKVSGGYATTMNMGVKSA